MSGGLITDKLKIKNDSKIEIVIDDYKTIREEFIYGLNGIINTIFSKNEPFTMTTDTRGKCSYCPYKALCMR